MAKGIAFKQSVGLTAQLVAFGFLQDEILRRVEEFQIPDDQTS